MTKIIENLKKHNSRGQSVLFSTFKSWRDPVTRSDIFGPVIAYSWTVDEKLASLKDPKKNFSLHLLPDASGFICFENPWVPNNYLLLDAYAKERVHLTVPWQLTKPQNPKSADPPTFFAPLSDPYINPADGKPGQFGITAWVEYAGRYYFELDYHSGQFLWGREIRD